ncbi:hypothetical protein X992_5483 [Burkholderia pseudomallei MSHR5492]|nr:hypothetical protein X992_5483 [Burkholderia pseudomallei MSHR5492]
MPTSLAASRIPRPSLRRRMCWASTSIFTCSIFLLSYVCNKYRLTYETHHARLSHM